MAVTAFTFDTLLACLFPLALFFAAHRRMGGTWSSNLRAILTLTPKTPQTPPASYSLHTAYQSYTNYRRLAISEVTRRRTTYTTLSRRHKRLGNAIGYAEKLDRLKLVEDVNAVITQRIAELARAEYALGDPGAGNEDIGRVRESLKHFVRDWSVDGVMEREKMFSPILGVLKATDSCERARLGKRVLVPGAGLGRLAWEVSQLGYDTTANELSFFMNLAFRFLLSPETTRTPNEHTIRPFAHWFSHQRSNDSLFRAVHFPDVVPRLTPQFHLLEADFHTLKAPLPLPLPLSSDPDPDPPGFVWSKEAAAAAESASARARQEVGGYDYIITLFFIDTSPNVFATLEQVYALLRPGGTWNNLGPLLWVSGGSTKVELSLDEVICAAREIGFVVHDGDGDSVAEDPFARRTVECEYTADGNAMMRWIYKAEFWVATRPK